MFDAGRRPTGRHFYWLLMVVMVAWGFRLSAFGAEPVPQTGPPTTTVADTVYLADECLNASTWAKSGTTPAAGSAS